MTGLASFPVVWSEWPSFSFFSFHIVLGIILIIRPIEQPNGLIGWSRINRNYLGILFDSFSVQSLSS